MGQTAPRSLFGLMFSETEIKEWGDAGRLFTKPAGELTDNEIERLLSLRRLAAQRMQGVDAVLSPLRESLRRLLSTLDEIAAQTADGDAAQNLLRLVATAGQGFGDLSPLDIDILRSLLQITASRSNSNGVASAVGVASAAPMYPQQTATTGPPTPQVEKQELIYGGIEEDTEEALKQETAGLATSILRQQPANEAPKSAPAVSTPSSEAEEALKQETAGLADGILRQEPVNQAATSAPAVSAPNSDAEAVHEPPTPQSTTPNGRADMPGDYSELSDMALWQAISSGAARSPRDLQRLRRQKEGDDILYGGKEAQNDT